MVTLNRAQTKVFKRLFAKFDFNEMQMEQGDEDSVIATLGPVRIIITTFGNVKVTNV